MDNFLQSIPIFTSIGIFVFGVGYLIIQYRKGGNDASEDVLKLREQQVEALKDQIDILNKQTQEFSRKINELTGKVGELTGLLQAREKENEQLRAIILGRNPEVEIFYKEGMRYFTESKPIIDSMKTFMEKMAHHLETNTIELKTQTSELKHQSEVLEQIK